MSAARDSKFDCLPPVLQMLCLHAVFLLKCFATDFFLSLIGFCLFNKRIQFEALLFNIQECVLSGYAGQSRASCQGK